MRASDYIVAGENGLQVQTGVKIFAKLRRELAQLLQRKVREFAALLQTVADRIADLFVRLAERNPFVDQIGRSRQSIHKACLRGALHALMIELDLAHEAGHGLQALYGCLCGDKNRLLCLLQIFVVGERSSASGAPAMAPEPSGQKFTRLRQSARRVKSRTNISAYASSQWATNTGSAACR